MKTVHAVAYTTGISVLLAIVLVLAVSMPQLSAQQSVNQTDGPPSGAAVQTVYVLSGTTVTAICWAKSIDNGRRTTAVAISTCSKANPAVCTSTGHGLMIGTRPAIAISGATGTGWVSGAATINASWVATVVDANTFSIPVDTTGNGTLAGTVVFVTNAPRQTLAQWAVKMYTYSGSSVTATSWLGGSSGYVSKCSDATNTAIGNQ